MAKRKIIERLSHELEERACEMKSNGCGFDEIADSLGFESAFQLSKYRKKYPEFEEMLDEADRVYAAAIEKRLETIHAEVDDPDEAKILSNNLQKILEYKNPQRYSPRMRHDHNHVFDIAGALEAAKERLIKDVTLPLLPEIKTEEKDPTE